MSEKTDDDDWPGWERRIVSDKHLHAIGQMCVMYNDLEGFIAHLFATCFPTTSDFAEDLFHKMNNRHRVDLLRAIVESKEENRSIKDAILHALRCYDICTDNRNILMHASSNTDDENTDILWLRKRAASHSKRLLEFQLPLADLRRVADECFAVAIYVGELNVFVMDRQNSVWGILTGAGPEPLPERPPQPRKLTPYQPQEADTDGPPQPRSSGA